MKRCWQLLPGSEPTIHRWGDEYVVHHALSNDTYRLSLGAGRLLSEMMSAANEPANCGTSASLTCGADAEACLMALADLGFVTQC